MRTRRVIKRCLSIAVAGVAVIALAAYDAGCGTASIVILNRSDQPIREIRLINTPGYRHVDQTARTVWRGTTKIPSAQIRLRNLVQGSLHMEATLNDGRTLSSRTASEHDRYVWQRLPMEFLLIVAEDRIDQTSWFRPLPASFDPNSKMDVWPFMLGQLSRGLACTVREVREIAESFPNAPRGS